VKSYTSLQGDQLVAAFERETRLRQVVVHRHQEVVTSVLARIRAFGWRQMGPVMRSKQTAEWYCFVRKLGA